MPSVGDNHAADESTPWSARSVAHGPVTLGLLSIRSFPLNDDPVWKDFDSAVRDLMQKDAMLVYLRGRQLANLLVDGEVASGVTKTYSRKTPETAHALDEHVRDAGDGGACPEAPRRNESRA